MPPTLHGAFIAEIHSDYIAYGEILDERGAACA